MAWTTEKIKQLKKLWSKGKSTVEIGKELGISKNAVVGKVHRLELEARPSPIKKQEKPVRAKTKVTTDGKTHVGLLDLKMNSCRWPIGDPKDADFHFCGATASTGKPYCPEHCKIAYTSLKELTLQNAKAKKEKAVQQAQIAEKNAKKEKPETPVKEIKSTPKAVKVPAKETKAVKEKAKTATKATAKTTKEKPTAKPVKEKPASKAKKETKTTKEPAKKKAGKK